MAEKEVGKRSSMYVAICSRLLGIVITIFILILNLKSELLSNPYVTFQLILSIPLLMGSMLSQTKITNEDKLKKYYILNRVTTALAYGFLFNAIGLLVSIYVSLLAGVLFFVSIILIFLIMMTLDCDKKKIFNEGLSILVFAFLGLLPALKVY